jgi:Zn-dependent peptidase ImmA (M78 family)
MNVSQVAQTHFRAWNQQIFTDTDFFNAVKSSGIIYKETDLIKESGCYLIFENTPFILVNSTVKSKFKRWVQIHELAHYHLGHTPAAFSGFRHQKLDWEANIIASVALIPMTLLSRFSVYEIRDYYNYPIELIDCRLEVFVRLKI